MNLEIELKMHFREDNNLEAEIKKNKHSYFLILIRLTWKTTVRISKALNTTTCSPASWMKLLQSWSERLLLY